MTVAWRQGKEKEGGSTSDLPESEEKAGGRTMMSEEIL